MKPLEIRRKQMKNLTITVPNGATNHGISNLLCTPPSWTDYVIFYLTNYFARRSNNH